MGNANSAFFEKCLSRVTSFDRCDIYKRDISVSFFLENYHFILYENEKMILKDGDDYYISKYEKNTFKFTKTLKLFKNLNCIYFNNKEYPLEIDIRENFKKYILEYEKRPVIIPPKELDYSQLSAFFEAPGHTLNYNCRIIDMVAFSLRFGVESKKSVYDFYSKARVKRIYDRNFILFSKNKTYHVKGRTSTNSQIKHKEVIILTFNDFEIIFKDENKNCLYAYYLFSRARDKVKIKYPIQDFVFGKEIRIICKDGEFFIDENFLKSFNADYFNFQLENESSLIYLTDFCFTEINYQNQKLLDFLNLEDMFLYNKFKSL